VTPRQTGYKKLIDILVLKVAVWYLTDGWRPKFTFTKRERLRRSNREAVRELKEELKIN
jgi:hypothetical protein